MTSSRGTKVSNPALKVRFGTCEYPEYNMVACIFHHPDFGKIHALTNNGKPWFVVEDIAAVFDMFPIMVRSVVSPKSLRFFKNKKISLLEIKDEADGVDIMTQRGLDSFLKFCAREYPERHKKFQRWLKNGMLPVLHDAVLLNLSANEEIDDADDDDYADDDDDNRETDEDVEVDGDMVLYNFSHPKFGNIRAATIEGEPHFILEDIEEALHTLGVSEERIQSSVASVTGTDKTRTKKECFCFLDEGEMDSILAFHLKGASPDVKQFICWLEAAVMPELATQCTADNGK